MDHGIPSLNEIFVHLTLIKPLDFLLLKNLNCLFLLSWFYSYLMIYFEHFFI